MIERGDNVDGMTVRATVPVNLRPLEHARKLGNHFGLVFLDLPIGEGNPVRRLERIAECMNQLKSSRQAVVVRSEEHTSELQSLVRISSAVFCLKKKKEIKRQ